jgi:hypothetical protein
MSPSSWSSASSTNAATRSRLAAAACSVFADTTISSGDRLRRRDPRAGASSTTTCALVPPMPKALTPPRRTPSIGSHALAADGTHNAEVSRSSAGFGAVKCATGGIVRCRRASAILISATTPAAVSRCPTLDLSAVSASGARSGPSNTCRSAATSIGSPSAVPVPCVSTSPTVAGSTSATSSAAAITAACPDGPGAVNPALRAPSLFTADPAITAWIVSPSCSASSSRFSTTTPAPSAGTVPAASRSNARQRPSGEKMPPGSCRCPRRVGGATVAPPANARSAS